MRRPIAATKGNILVATLTRIFWDVPNYTRLMRILGYI